jgi:hypothetical protein
MSLKFNLAAAKLSSAGLASLKKMLVVACG